MALSQPVPPPPIRALSQPAARPSPNRRRGPAAVTLFAYDANRNRTAMTLGGDTIPYYYNLNDQLVKTADLIGGFVTFDYDDSGMRVKKIGSAGETRYLYDDNATLLEYDGASGQTFIKYNYGGDLLSLTDVSSARRIERFYLYDALGSTSELSNTAGGIQVSYQYDAWGNIRQAVGSSDNPIQYPGHFSDLETGLDYFGARYHDAGTGTFLSQDSYLGQSDAPPSLHRYLYAYADPLSYTDPTGHDAAATGEGQQYGGSGNSLVADEGALAGVGGGCNQSPPRRCHVSRPQ